MPEKKVLYNFYLEPSVKNALMDKLEDLIGEKPKGTLAALIRVQLKLFLATPNDRIKPELLDAIDAEYEYTAKLNKRSKN